MILTRWEQEVFTKGFKDGFIDTYKKCFKEIYEKTLKECNIDSNEIDWNEIEKELNDSLNEIDFDKLSKETLIPSFTVEVSFRAKKTHYYWLSRSFLIKFLWLQQMLY